MIRQRYFVMMIERGRPSPVMQLVTMTTERIALFDTEKDARAKAELSQGAAFEVYPWRHGGTE